VRDPPAEPVSSAVHAGQAVRRRPVDRPRRRSVRAPGLPAPHPARCPRRPDQAAVAHAPHAPAQRAPDARQPGVARRAAPVPPNGQSPRSPVLRPQPLLACVREVLDVVLDRFENTDRVADLARTSTFALLTDLGWSGDVLESSAIPTRQGRSERLADLAVATGSTHYLCGTGGLRYLDHQPFAAHGITVLPFHTPVDTGDRLWQWARRVSSLWALSEIGPSELATRLAAGREAHFLGCGTEKATGTSISLETGYRPLARGRRRYLRHPRGSCVSQRRSGRPPRVPAVLIGSEPAAGPKGGAGTSRSPAVRRA
jgi:hypothetical protein